MIRALTVALVFTLACGSNKPAPVTTAPTPTEHAAVGGGSDETKAMPPELAKFHDLISPLWHAAKGPQRMKDTCAALPEMHATSSSLAKTTPPTTAHADLWTTGTRSLVAAVATLDTSCKSNDATAFETAFANVHASFHNLLAQATGHGEGEADHGAMDQGAMDQGGMKHGDPMLP